jgi:DNA-binding SARP family transcriptional activator
MELHDDAALVLLESADHEGLAGLILQQAPVLIAQGRLETLGKWLSALPPETIRAEPWHLYWLGMCRLAFDPASARETLEQAYEAFRERDDARGRYSALSGIVETLILEATDLNPLRKWVDELDRLDQTRSASSLGDLEPQIVLTAVDALLYGCPDHPRVSYWVERAETLLKGRLDPKHAVPLTAHFAFYRCCVGDFAEARGLGSDLSRLYKESAQPMVRIYCCGIRSVIAWLHGKRHEAEELVRAALEEGKAHGVHVLDARILGQACYATGNCGDAEAFERYLKQFTAIPQLGAFDKAQLTFFSSWLALLHGDYLGARREIETSVAALEKLGFPWMLAVQRSFKTQVLTATGDLQEAEQLNGMVTQFAEGMGSDILRFQTQLNDAWIALRRGNEHECRIALSQGLRFGRIRGYSIHPCAPPEMMSELCCLALEHDIEVEHVRELIRAHYLSPPASAIDPDAWPWPVKVYTLGRFAVLIDGHSLHFDKKAQKKPLELLKALIAFGGQNVGEQVLLEALWPETEGDAAAQALATTVHRLRKLLGADALRRQEGRLSLDAEHCWVDTWALARALARLEEASATGDHDDLGGGVEAVFRLYTGGFLERDPVASWMIAPRERLRAKLLRALVNAGQVLCRNGYRVQAVACYEKALEVEPLAEDVYRELIRCHLADGHPAQALSVFQRCQQIFQAELGLSPSAEIEALYEEVRNS